MLDEIIKEKTLSANAVVGLFAANSIGDDIEVYGDEKRSKILTTFHTLRQQQKKTDKKPYLALSDFIAPRDTGLNDYIGVFAVTAGINIETLVKKYEKDHDDYKSIMIKALADRLVEAFAEHIHEKTRKEVWAYAADEKLLNEELIQCKYQGIRPAPGYPAQPDHTEKPILFDLLDVKKNAKIQLTESNAMSPAASICGLYFAHPDSKYFALGKIDKDQIADYAKRKNTEIPIIEKWLSPHLRYK